MSVSKIVSIPIEITFSKKASKSTPVRYQADFEEYAAPKLIDPHTIRVIRKLNGQSKTYNVQFDEMLYYGNQGWIAWLVDNPESAGQWSIEFSLREENGKLADHPYMPIVGVGDQIFATQKKYNPIGVPGMHQFPIPVDFDGNGVMDLISTSHYSNTQNMLWAGVFLWKNLGTNEKPCFGPPLRLAADGVNMHDTPDRRHKIAFKPRYDFISEYYIRCDVFDWFNKSSQDLITISTTGKIKVYRNLGTFDKTGRPEFELALKIPIPKCLAPTSYISFRVIDWDDSGRGSFLIGVSDKEASAEYGQLFLMRNIGTSPERPKFNLEALSIKTFGWNPNSKGRHVSMNDPDWRKFQNFPGFRTWCLDWFDIDNDGQKELIVMHGNQRPEVMMEVWKNVGTIDKPLLRNQEKLPWFSLKHYFGFRFIKDKNHDGCFIGKANSGGGMLYYERQKDDPYDKNSYKFKGILTGQGAKLQGEGYVRPWPVKDNNTINLLLGDEAGYLSYSQNYGTKNKPKFDWPKKLTDSKGNILHLCRENLLQDGDPEWCCGQLKPAVYDWDGDGKLDIILSGNPDRIYWLKQFNPQNCTTKGMVEITVQGVDNAFGWRKGIAVLDFDGDGKSELLAINSQEELCIYKQTENPAILTESQKLKFSNGKVITSLDIPPKFYRYGIVVLFAFDYTKSGTYDLLVSSNYNTSLLENIGTNKKPLFKRPKLLKTLDGPISVCHHESHVAVADINDDGIEEVIIGGESGKVYVFHRDWLDCIKHKVRPSKACPAK